MTDNWASSLCDRVSGCQNHEPPIFIWNISIMLLSHIHHKCINHSDQIFLESWTKLFPQKLCESSSGKPAMNWTRSWIIESISRVSCDLEISHKFPTHYCFLVAKTDFRSYSAPPLSRSRTCSHAKSLLTPIIESLLETLWLFAINKWKVSSNGSHFIARL